MRVAFFSSGDELRQPGDSLGPGQIYNSNRFTLSALVARAGAEPVDLGHVADSFDATVKVLEQTAAGADVIVGSGGVSVGEEDHVKRALEQVGTLELWRVAVKPGKPLAYGRIGEADFLGLPGNPVSTFVTFCLFVRPFLYTRMGMHTVAPRFWPVTAGFQWPRPRQRREFARARLEAGDDGSLRAVLHPRQGSDVMSSTTWADGLVEIPEGITVSPGDRLRFLDFPSLTA